MYQYIQGWKMDYDQFHWLYKHDDWDKGLDLFGEKIWVKIDGDKCIVKSLWGLFRSGVIGKLGKGYYSYCVGDTCYIVYRFGWCWNSNQDWPVKSVWELLIDEDWAYSSHTKIRPIKSLDKSPSL